MSTTAIFLLAILALGFLITFQIAKASEYVSVLKGEKKAFEQSNRINAFLLVVFLVLGLIGYLVVPRPVLSKKHCYLSFRFRTWREDRQHDVHYHRGYGCCILSYPDPFVLVLLINTSTTKKERPISIPIIRTGKYSGPPFRRLRCCAGRFWFVLLVQYYGRCAEEFHAG